MVISDIVRIICRLCDYNKAKGCCVFLRKTCLCRSNLPTEYLRGIRKPSNWWRFASIQSDQRYPFFFSFAQDKLYMSWIPLSCMHNGFFKRTCIAYVLFCIVVYARSTLLFFVAQTSLCQLCFCLNRFLLQAKHISGWYLVRLLFQCFMCRKLCAGLVKRILTLVRMTYRSSCSASKNDITNRHMQFVRL